MKTSGTYEKIFWIVDHAGKIIWGYGSQGFIRDGLFVQTEFGSEERNGANLGNIKTFVGGLLERLDLPGLANYKEITHTFEASKRDHIFYHQYLPVYVILNDILYQYKIKMISTADIETMFIQRKTLAELLGTSEDLAIPIACNLLENKNER